MGNTGVLKKQLIEQMGRKDHTLALGAVEELSIQGWLYDGSLKGVALRKANLEGAILTAANLENATLDEGNLDGAELSRANLQDAYLHRTNLKRASLNLANLEGAQYLTIEQLKQAAELEGATLPDGTRLPDDGSWQIPFAAWCKTVPLDEAGYIIPSKVNG